MRNVSRVRVVMATDGLSGEQGTSPWRKKMAEVSWILEYAIVRE